MPAIIQTILVLTFLAAGTYYLISNIQPPLWFVIAGAAVLAGLFWGR